MFTQQHTHTQLQMFHITIVLAFMYTHASTGHVPRAVEVLET